VVTLTCARVVELRLVKVVGLAIWQDDGFYGLAELRGE
jgi:hypothetical protein